MHRAAVTLAALVASIAGAGAAHAGEPAARELAAAQAHWRDLDYELVVPAADRTLAAPDATREQKLEALRLKGSAFVVLNETAAAKAAFVEIFALDPDYDLPRDTSPRVKEVFGPARAEWQVAEEARLATELGASLAALSLDVTLPARPRGGTPLAVVIDLVDPDRIADAIVLSYRRSGGEHWSTLTTDAKPGRRTLTIPGAFTASDRAYTLELFVGARHRSGVTLRRRGEPDRPLSLPVAAGQVPVATPLHEKWWFWVGTAAVVTLGVFLTDQALDVGPQRIELVIP